MMRARAQARLGERPHAQLVPQPGQGAPHHLSHLSTPHFCTFKTRTATLHIAPPLITPSCTSTPLQGPAPAPLHLAPLHLAPLHLWGCVPVPQRHGAVLLRLQRNELRLAELLGAEQQGALALRGELVEVVLGGGPEDADKLVHLGHAQGLEWE